MPDTELLVGTKKGLFVLRGDPSRGEPFDVVTRAFAGDVVEFATRACRPEAEALLCSCTAWRSVEAARAIEERTGRPVVSSNQSTIWTALRALGITEPVRGFGRLLESLAPARPVTAAG